MHIHAQSMEDDLPRQKHVTGIVLFQARVRGMLGRRRAHEEILLVYRKVFSPHNGIYFYFNKQTHESTWRPCSLVSKAFHTQGSDAARKLQRVLRGFLASNKARLELQKRYEKLFDADSGKFYLHDKQTGLVSWNPSPFVRRYERHIQTRAEDQQLHDTYNRMMELERRLQDKETEIAELRAKRLEELEHEAFQHRLRDAQVKRAQRSQNMDEWSVEEVADLFQEMHMEQYVPYVEHNRVDGLLLVNLQDQDFADMGISNAVHQRKLQLVLKAYRYRYARRQRPLEREMDDDLVSEYGPSEISDLIDKDDAEVAPEERNTSSEGHPPAE
jgi:hypothetical protein